MGYGTGEGVAGDMGRCGGHGQGWLGTQGDMGGVGGMGRGWLGTWGEPVLLGSGGTLGIWGGWALVSHGHFWKAGGSPGHRSGTGEPVGAAGTMQRGAGSRRTEAHGVGGGPGPEVRGTARPDRKRGRARLP